MTAILQNVYIYKFLEIVKKDSGTIHTPVKMKPKFKVGNNVVIK